MGRGEKPARTEAKLAKTMWGGISWNWEGKPARIGGQTRQIQGGKPAATCGGNWPEPQVGEISQNWSGKLTRTGRKKWPKLGREKWLEEGGTCSHLLKVLLRSQEQLSLSCSCGICLMV